MDPIITTRTGYTARISCEIVNSSLGINVWIQQVKFTPRRLTGLPAAGTLTRLHISARSSNRPTDTDTQDNEDPVRFKGHHSSSGSNKSRNHRDVPTGISHTQTRAHRLGLFKAQRLIYSRRVEEVEVLPVQSFPLPLHSPL